jgi:hypothetical protein
MSRCMKHNATLALALAVAACSHNERPAEPSSASVDQATNAPSDTDFTPPANRVDDTTATTGTPGDATTRDVATTPAGSPNSGTSALSPASGTTTNDNTTNTTTTTTSSSPGTGAGVQPAGGKPADNTAVNQRDRDDKSLTPMDQGGSEADR